MYSWGFSLYAMFLPLALHLRPLSKVRLVRRASVNLAIAWSAMLRLLWRNMPSASFAQSRFHSESISLYRGGTIDREVLAMGSLCTLSGGSLQRGLWQSGRSLVQGGKRMWEIYLMKLGIPHDWKHPERTKVFKTPQLPVSLIGVWPLRSWPSAYSKSEQLHAMSIGHHSSCQRQ